MDLMDLSKLTNIIETNVCLKMKNCYRIPCVAKYYSEPKTPKQVSTLLSIINKYKTNHLILGGGYNLLLEDGIYDGLVIYPINLKLDKRKVGCSHSIDTYIKYCLDNNLVGLEVFSGIPGNLGGCVNMNIHYKNFTIDKFIEKVGIISLSGFKYIDIDDLSNKNIGIYVIWEIVFNLLEIPRTNIKNNIDERNTIISIRKSRYPDNLTCGCFFSNLNEKEGKYKSIGYYSDFLNLNTKIKNDNAYIWKKHGNMIVSNGKASQNDILEIAEFIKSEVEKFTKTKIMPECIIVKNKKQT